MHRRIPCAPPAGGALAVALCLALGACSTTPPAPGPTPSVASPVAPAPTTAARPASGVSPDFDGDGAADLAVGGLSRPLTVAVRYANGRQGDIAWEDLSSQPGSAYFGQALLSRDFNADGFSDLLVSSPDPEATSLFWIYGSRSGLDVAGAVTTVIGGVPGAGRALALATEPQKVVVVGGGSTAGAGVVLAYRLGADGRPGGNPERFTPEDLGLPALPAGSRFGTTLAASRAHLVIGAPEAPVGQVRGAGAVYTVDLGREPLRATRLTQDSPGVPDKAQAGDRFGAALAMDAKYLVVGVPGEDRLDESGRNQRRTGAVQAFRVAGANLVPDVLLDQKDLPGDLEAGDGFGFAVSMVQPCEGNAGVLVGAFAEAIGKREQAGSVWVVPLGTNLHCFPVQLWDGSGLGDKAAPNTLVGSAVSVLRQRLGGDTLVIAAQGIAEEGVPGRVLTLDHPYDEQAVEAIGGIRIAEEQSLVLSSPEG